MGPVAGVGVDLVEIDRVRRLLDGSGGTAALDRLFTAREREAAARRPDPAAHLAACFAAKEALVKALGCGLCRQVSWREVTVVDEPPGPPSLALAGATARFVAERGGARALLTLGRADDLALAVVILER